MTRLALLALAFSAATACAASIQYDFTRTTTAAATVKPADCRIELFTTPPGKPFVELGVLDWRRRGTRRAHNAADFMRAVRPQVCGVGGNAVLAEVNDDGAYVRGTVIRLNGDETVPALKEWP